MLDFLPNTQEKYEKSLKEYGELLETIVIEDIFMPEIVELLHEERKNDIKAIFDYIEEVVNRDAHLREILSVTMMEILGNNQTILNTAQKYMGKTSKKLQLEADRELGRL